MSPLDLVVSVLAARRITRLVVEDEITRPIREEVGRAATSGKIHPKFEYLVNCARCVSVWAAIITLILPRKARIALAVSEGAILTGTVTELLE